MIIGLTAALMNMYTSERCSKTKPLIPLSEILPKKGWTGDVNARCPHTKKQREM